MINVFRLQKMIHLARYEAHGGEKEMKICRYYRGDYISLQMIQTFLLTTIADILVVLLVILSDVDKFLLLLEEADLVRTGIWLLLFYAISLLIFLQITYISAAGRYDRARRHLKRYKEGLASLTRLNSRSA
ncbi:MAG: hypothetical protein Q4B15_06545 [Lachnospiraceae bacterium]|nr:hypothetical protein [Lachnospiraceae bacterium]